MSGGGAQARWVASLGALALGVVLAGAGGARLGDDVAEWRTQSAAGEAVSAPPPGLRLAQWWARGGVWWLAGIGLVTAGAWSARRSARDAAEAGGEEAAPDVVIGIVRAEVRALRAGLEGVAEDGDTGAAREALDRVHAKLIDPVVEGRGRWFARQGVGVAAAWFSPLSAAERQLRRAWSALTDGYVGEARAALDAAARSLEAADDGWRAAVDRAGGDGPIGG
jgi:hypothetical protein